MSPASENTRPAIPLYAEHARRSGGFFWLSKIDREWKEQFVTGKGERGAPDLVNRRIREFMLAGGAA